MQIESVSELISLLTTFDDFQATGLRYLIENLSDPGNSTSNVYRRYLASQPTAPHLFELLIFSLAKNTTDNNSFLASCASLLNLAIKTLLKLDMRNDAVRLSHRILEDPEIIPFTECIFGLNTEALASSLDLLATIASDLTDSFLVSALLTTVDLTKASAVLYEKSSNEVVRTALLKLIISIIKEAAIEERITFGHQSTLLTSLFEGLPNNPPALVIELIDVLRKRIIFNEEKSRNISILYFKHGRISLIGRLCLGPLSENLDQRLVQLAARNFLIHCCANPESTLVYKTNSLNYSLCNRIIYELIRDVDLVGVWMRRPILLDTCFIPILETCPDVAFEIISNQIVKYVDFSVCEKSTHKGTASGLIINYKADDDQKSVGCPQNSLFSSFVSLSLIIKILKNINLANIIINSKVTIFNKSLLTRGVLCENRLLRHHTLFLIAEILDQFSNSSVGDTFSEETISILQSILPDAQTLYNSWRNTLISSDSIDGAMHSVYIRAMYLYLKHLPRLSSTIAESIKISDIWSFEKLKFCSEKIVSNGLQLLGELDPIRLLVINSFDNDLKVLEDIFQKCKNDQLAQKVVARWMFETGLVVSSFENSLQFAQMYPCFELVKVIVSAYKEPLVLGAGKQHRDPIALIMCKPSIITNISAQFDKAPSNEIENTFCSTDSKPDILCSPELIVSNFAHEPVFNPKRSSDKDTYLLLSTIITDGSVEDFVTSTIALLQRHQVYSAYRRIDPLVKFDTQEKTEMTEILDLLVNKIDFLTWIRLLGQLFHENSGDLSANLVYQIIDCGLVGLVVIGLSVEDMNVCRLSHLILNRLVKFLEMLSLNFKSDDLRNMRNTLAPKCPTLLHLLKFTIGHQHYFDEQPFQLRLPRVVSFFYAESFAFLLRPEHEMHRTVVELLLDSRKATVNLAELSRRLLLRSAQSEGDFWAREGSWLVHLVDAATGDQYMDACEGEIKDAHLTENLATLILSIDPSYMVGRAAPVYLRKMAAKLLQKLSPPWINLFCLI